MEKPDFKINCGKLQAHENVASEVGHIQKQQNIFVNSLPTFSTHFSPLPVRATSVPDHQLQCHFFDVARKGPHEPVSGSEARTNRQQAPRNRLHGILSPIQPSNNG